MTRPRSTTSQADELGATLASLKARLQAIEIQTHTHNGIAAPTGSLVPFAGAMPPSGWLLCFGQAVLRSLHEDLFAVIGTTYGVGDGVTTFNLPDLRGRVIAGEDDMGGGAANRLTSVVSGVNGVVLGATGGDQRTPTHSHPNTLSNNTVGSSAHTHQHTSPIGLNNTNIRIFDPNDGTLDVIGTYGFNAVVGAIQAAAGGKFSDNVERYVVTSTSPSATTTVGITNADNASGGGSQNVQPTIVLNYIIKA